MIENLSNLVLNEFLYWSNIREDMRLLPILEIYNNSKEINMYDTLNRVRDYCGFNNIYTDNEVKPDYKLRG